MFGGGGFGGPPAGGAAGGEPAHFDDVPVDRLRAQILTLMRSLARAYPDVTGFDRDFGAIESSTAQASYFGDYSAACAPVNKNKNRYSNVLPPESTRLKLVAGEDEDEGAEYINANLVLGRDLPPAVAKAAAADAAATKEGEKPQTPWRVPEYIATQGPLEWTIGDFWRMVWEQNVSVVIMLTKEIENGRVKCDHYWPDADAPMHKGRYRVELESVDEGEELVTRHLRLVDPVSSESRSVTQFQYTAWPDHGLPPSTTAYLELSRRADDANTTNAPLVVHCSAGIGRSGTFCTVHSTMELIQWQMDEQVRKHGRVVSAPTVNIPETVIHFRHQRPGMIQTREQFMFCFLAIMEEGERLLEERNGPAAAAGTADAAGAEAESSSPEEPTQAAGQGAAASTDDAAAGGGGASSDSSDAGDDE